MTQVAIALPCYNAEKTVGATVRSILAQTFDDWELLALDDGSTDGTVDMLKSFDDPRIKVISDGTNKGRCHRLNQAAELAQGTYYARMDSDDLMFPDRLKKQVDFLEANPDVDLLGGGLVSINEDLTPLGVRYAPERVTSPVRIFAGEVLYHPTVMGRVDWFRTHPYVEGYLYSDDFASWTKYARDLTIANLQEPLIFYLEHGVFTYDKYRGRQQETRQAIADYGPEAIGRLATTALLCRRWIKDLAYATLHYTGLWKRSLSVVNRALDENLRVEYSAMLDSYRQKAP